MTCSLSTSSRNVRKSTNLGNLGGPPSILTRVLGNGLPHLARRVDTRFGLPTHNRHAHSPRRGLFRPETSPGEGDASAQNSPVSSLLSPPGHPASLPHYGASSELIDRSSGRTETTTQGAC
ncbi:hypothetical protein E2C01_070694 [Portunus trituberculatus]|uniref:Uncharacterized protein n=1 Tax=Portunus trituberculatus TaxID=210409 RepID=A0A5B7I2B9_PORTR|nr:hypothetical protein [Portunus trituberculatus]